MTETRAQKAQQLMDEGRVVNLTTLTGVVEAWVIDGCDKYAVALFNDGTFECYCEWGSDHVLTDDLCAHALAVKLIIEKENTP